MQVFYNDAVRRHFNDPRHAGDLADSFDQTLEAQAGDFGKGARIAIAAGLRDGTIEAMVFRAWGCPHLIAAADRTCELFQGQPVTKLEKCDLSNISRELGIPTEKSGRVLLLEDALAGLWAEYGGTTD